MTRSGQIDARHPVTVGSFSGRQLQGRVRSGGPHLAIQTVSGDIELR
jgi:hypothetical protein